MNALLIFVWIWGTSTTLRQDLGVLTWIPLIIMIPLLVVQSIKLNRKLVIDEYIYIFLVFIFIVFINLYSSSDIANTFVRGLKFLILCILIAYMLAITDKKEFIKNLVVIYLLINFLALIVAWCFSGYFGGEGGGGRWWTLVNLPGGLYT